MDESLAGGSLLAMMLFLSMFIEFMTERLFGSIEKLKGLPMVLIAATGGVLLCIFLNLDALQLVGFEGDYESSIGQVISGLVIGAGSNVVHKFFDPSHSGG